MRIAIIAATRRRGIKALFEKGYTIKEKGGPMTKDGTEAYVIEWETDIEGHEWDGYYELYGAHRRNRYREIMKAVEYLGIVKLKEL